MLAGHCNCCQPPYRCTFTHSFLDFLLSNVNMLITSSLNPSIQIPLKKSVAHPLFPLSFLLPPPSFPALPRRPHTKSLYLELDDGQAEHDDTKDCARNIKCDMRFHSGRQTQAEIKSELFHCSRKKSKIKYNTVVLRLNVKWNHRFETFRF